VSDATASCECGGGCCGTPAAPTRTAVALPDERLDAGLKALASVPRRNLIRIIAANSSADGACCDTDVCACKLSEALELAPSTISHHMAVLVGAGLVSATKRGLWVYYRLERDALAALAAEIGSF
jgi:ArsR family transcriptional regulator